MSTVLKKENAEKVVFKHNPKFIRIQPSTEATSFVNMQAAQTSDFEIADVVAQQSGIAAMKQKNLEDKAEETVLERMKEIQEQAYKQAYDLGLIEGTNKAFDEKQQDFMLRLERFDQLCKNIESHLTFAAQANEATLVKLVYQIADRVARKAIAQDPAPLVEMLRNTVHELQEAIRIVVQINPADLKFIEELRSKKEKIVESFERVKFEVDERIQSGGCMIETDFGTIDATVEQRIERAWQALEARLPVAKSTDNKDGV